MLYYLIKAWVRCALSIFCRKRLYAHKHLLDIKGPTLITANHPNSFLDAIIIGASCRYPMYFLARGDAFNQPWHAKLLGWLQMIPVYRLSEGKENLALNETAFKKSREVLEGKGILLIFIEGICVNSHQLQPFKKGAARIALDCRHIPGMKVMPLAIAYDSFRNFGKTVSINPGQPIPVDELLPFAEDTKNMRHMNERLFADIASLIRIPETAADAHPLLIIPAIIGRLLHTPLYLFLKNKIAAKTKGTVFYDSVLFGALLFIYPLYLLVFGLILSLCQIPFAIVVLIIVLHPFTAWCAVQQKRR